MEKTTIQVNLSTLERLKQLKKHSRQSYDELLNEVIDEAQADSLSDKDLAEIQASLEDIKAGRTYSIEQVAKEFGVKL